MPDIVDVAAAAVQPVPDGELATANGEASRRPGGTSTACTVPAPEAPRSDATANGSPLVSSDDLFATTIGGNFAQIGVGW
jgi:hypothetical protein